MVAEMGDSFEYYWETQCYLDSEELGSMFGGHEDTMSSYYDSSSPDGASNSSSAAAAAVVATKNIVMERHRRKRLNDKLYALRSVVPNITKMDKASIIKDAIVYIQLLQQQERQMLAEISHLESSKTEQPAFPALGDNVHTFSKSKKTKRAPSCSSIASPSPATAASPPVQILEVRVSPVADKMLVVSVICGSKRDTMVKVCRAFEALQLKVVTVNITSISGKVIHTVFVEREEMHHSQMKEMIEAAIAQLDVIASPLSSMSY